MRRFVPATTSSDPPVFSEMNTTPLIDVMLVLLVMVIITIPMLNHEVPIDIPRGRVAPEERVTHRLEIMRDGAVFVDGAATSDAALLRKLAVLRADPRAELTVRTDPQARYDHFARTLVVVKRAGITRLGFVGHQAMLDQGG